MSDDELDNLTEQIGTGDADELEERLDGSQVSEDMTGESVEDILDAVGSEDPEKSAGAADELERIVEEEPERLDGYQDELIDALEIDDNWAKRAAVSALKQVGDEDALDALRGVGIPEAEDAVEAMETRLGIEYEEDGTDGTNETDTMDPDTDSSEGEEEEPALSAAKNGDSDVSFEEIVVLQMLESKKDKPKEFATESVRHAVREYPDTVKPLSGDFAETMNDGREDLRRYASVVVHEMSEEYVEELRESVPNLVEGLSDEDAVVRENAEEALTNVAEEYPQDVVGNVAESSKPE